jgi:FLVCR family feline leukemia virus subgroup C receptor-related protein
LYAFGTVLGSFNIYGSLLDNILDCYDFSTDEVSYLAGTMMIVGIISAALIGIYIEKTLKYRRVFIPLGLFGIIQSVCLPLVLIYKGHSFPLALVIVFLQGVIFIPLMPLSFDYGCDILFPAGEAQITGCLMTSGNLFGLIFVLLYLFRSFLHSKHLI